MRNASKPSQRLEARTGVRRMTPYHRIMFRIGCDEPTTLLPGGLLTRAFRCRFVGSPPPSSLSTIDRRASGFFLPCDGTIAARQPHVKRRPRNPPAGRYPQTLTGSLDP